MPEGIETRYARCGGAHIAYQVAGAGPVTLLMSSYGSISIDSFDDEPRFARFLERLASYVRIVRYDRRGVGLSDPISPAAPPTLEQDVDDAVAVLDAVGVERAAVFGQVQSGMHAILHAATRPQRTSALVLVNAYARLERAPDYPPGLPPELLARFEDDITSPDSPSEVGSVLAVAAPSVAADDDFVRWWDGAGRRGASPATARALWRVGFHADVRPVLGSIRAPALVVHRRECEWVRVGHGRYLAEHIPGARYVEIDGADTPAFTGDNAHVVVEEISEFLTGERRPEIGDRVLATILFTDIVSSTEHAARLGDARWRALLDRHDAMARASIRRFDGREVKTTGDGFLATFGSPAAAIRCAVAVREGGERLGMAIRAGVHAGEVETRADDVLGIAVHVGQRISALAAAGEVLVSSTVRELVAGSGIDFADRGAHRLKGVDDEWRVFAVVWPDPSSGGQSRSASR